MTRLNLCDDGMYRTHATIKEAQVECREMRALGTPDALARAQTIEAQWKNHPEYESDYAYIMRKQAGP